MHIVMSPDLEQFVAGQVASGRHPDASAVVREALERFQECEELRPREIRGQSEIGSPGCVDDALARLRAEGAERRQQLEDLLARLEGPILDAGRGRTGTRGAVRGGRWPPLQRRLDWSQCPVVEQIPGKMSGAWVLKDTRMPVAMIFEQLEAGANIDNLLDWFDGLDRAQIQAVFAFVARSAAPLPPPPEARAG